MFNQPMTLVTLALLACPSDVYDSELFYMPAHRHACSIIVSFIKRVIFCRKRCAERIRNAELKEDIRGFISYDEYRDHRGPFHRARGAHVIDSEGNHHIVCHNMIIQTLPVDTTHLTLVSYKDQHGYFDHKYRSDSTKLVEWAKNRREYRSDPTGQSIVNLAKFGIFAK